MAADHPPDHHEPADERETEQQDDGCELHELHWPDNARVGPFLDCEVRVSAGEPIYERAAALHHPNAKPSPIPTLDDLFEPEHLRAQANDHHKRHFDRFEVVGPEQTAVRYPTLARRY